MQPLRFRVKSVDGDIRAEIEREVCPSVGQSLLVFDYPYVARFVVEQLEPRKDVLPFDLLEPATIVLRRAEVIEQSNRAKRGIGIDLANDLVARVEKIGELARTYITEKLALEICHADLVELCAGSGLTSDIASIDLFLFRGIPMTVGERDCDWNAYTAFCGFNDDMCVLYVTLPGGQPFVMEPRYLELMRKIGRGEVMEDEAVEDVCLGLVEKGLPITDTVLQRIKNAVSLAVEGIMPPYDAAQELVRVTQPAHCSEALADTTVQCGSR
ncbi:MULTISPECIES: hypothetical protein [Asticcacaulis]|uniref:hypothetical protein n=1 Tax=Asticcacaulis TaxID=76890 RepID=UPI001AE3F04B|nr:MULTISPECIES: hypothetical protein [Asticcacaulis]MBP2159113.1 hypothetical protein [Asticcacaulis solisilvae]MDR6800158.1 hypothetical protein [Asticcacaulis sp. BE141]